MKCTQLLKFLTVLFTIAGCAADKREVDISNVKIDFRFYRFEKDLLQLKPEASPSKIADLEKKYGVFFKRFNENMIQIGSASRPDYSNNINGFLNDAAIATVYEEVQKEFPTTSSLSQEFETGLKYYHYYFPKRTVPQIATFISGFNHAIAVTDSILGIGLDMYLGKDCNYYKLMTMPQYQIDYMSKEYIVTDAMRSWLQSEFESPEAHSNLLSEMIFQGKLLFALDFIMPQAQDSIKMEFSSTQLKWLNSSEAAIWTYFVDKNLLYSTKITENVKYINPAPFTAGMPKESPGRVGVWLGFKIVSAYMNSNSKLTLAELMNEKDAQKILNQSHYKPKK
jgi:hypothetical protein